MDEIQDMADEETRRKKNGRDQKDMELHTDNVQQEKEEMIALYNLEPKYTNIALEKIKLFYLTHNERIRDYNPLEHTLFDYIYCSSIFTFTNKSYVTNDMICGGSGFDLVTILEPRIEQMKPKINIGYTTRGCIRKCPFCIVPQKEGNIKIVGDIYDFWDKRSDKIVILDNNILAKPEHFKTICEQIRRESLKVDFCQGLDIRLMTDELAYHTTIVRHIKQLHIAWDNVKEERKIMKGIKNLLKYKNPQYIMCYVLIGYNSTEEEDLYRTEKLKELKIDPFVMPFNKKDKYQKRFARWVNHKAIFKSVAWEDYK